MTEANVSSWTNAMETTTNQDFDFESSSSLHHSTTEISTKDDLNMIEFTTNRDFDFERASSLNHSTTEISTQDDLNTTEFKTNRDFDFERASSLNQSTTDISTQDDLNTTEFTTNRDFDFERASSLNHNTTEISTLDDLNMTDTTKNESKKFYKPHISKAVYETFESIAWLGVIPTACLIGIAGNAIGVCFIIAHRKLNQPFMVYLLALMAADLIYLIMELFTCSIAIMERYNIPLADYWNCYAARPFLLVKSILHSTCTYFITAMSVERFLNIVFPFKIKFCSLQKYSVLNILLCVGLNAASMVQSFFLEQPKLTTDDKGNILTCISVPSDWAIQNDSFAKHYTLFIFVAVRFAPGTVATICNIIIALYLTLYRKQRAALLASRTSGGAYPNQGKITFILFVLTIFLILSMVPVAVGILLIRYSPEHYGPTKTQFYTAALLLDLGFILRAISAANDFFIYIFFVKSSRTLVKQMLMAKCCFARQ